ncbi:hypothetical protein [Streptomyces griseosporeus]
MKLFVLCSPFLAAIALTLFNPVIAKQIEHYETEYYKTFPNLELRVETTKESIAKLTAYLIDTSQLAVSTIAPAIGIVIALAEVPQAAWMSAFYIAMAVAGLVGFILMLSRDPDPERYFQSRWKAGPYTPVSVIGALCNAVAALFVAASYMCIT